MLTEEDKKWIAEQIAGVKKELVTELGARIDIAADRVLMVFRNWEISITPRLKADAVLIGTFETRLEGLEQRMLNIELAPRK